MGIPELAAPRAVLLAALRSAARADPAGLSAGLKLPASVAAAAIAADVRAATAPTVKALDRYRGVVYQSLDPASLTRSARLRAETDVLVTSGLWGLVRGGDPVPDYRVPASGTVPGLGGVSAHWRPALAVAVPVLVGDQPVLDLRSTDYRAMWRPGPQLRDQVVAVRVLAERGSGSRRTTAAVSYHAKHVKGLVARHLLTGRRRHTDPMAAIADAAAALDLRVVPTSRASHRSVDLVGRYP